MTERLKICNSFTKQIQNEFNYLNNLITVSKPMSFQKLCESMIEKEYGLMDFFIEKTDEYFEENFQKVFDECFNSEDPENHHIDVVEEKICKAIVHLIDAECEPEIENVTYQIRKMENSYFTEILDDIFCAFLDRYSPRVYVYGHVQGLINKIFDDLVKQGKVDKTGAFIKCMDGTK